MAGKGNKKRNSNDSTKGKDKKAKPKKRKNGNSGGGSSGTSKSSKFHGDIFGDGAMENAYLVCHNVQVCCCIYIFTN